MKFEKVNQTGSIVFKHSHINLENFSKIFNQRINVKLVLLTIFYKNETSENYEKLTCI